MKKQQLPEPVRIRRALERQAAAADAAVARWSAAAAAGGVLSIAFDRAWVVLAAVGAVRAVTSVQSGRRARAELRTLPAPPPLVELPPLPVGTPALGRTSVNDLARSGLDLAAEAMDAALRRRTGAAGAGRKARDSSSARQELESAERIVVAVDGLLRQLPVQFADTARSAHAAALEALGIVRAQAARVAACETALNAIRDPSRREAVEQSLDRLIAGLRAGVDALEEMLAAAGELVAATAPASRVSGAPTPTPSLSSIRLNEAVTSLRGLAAALAEQQA